MDHHRTAFPPGRDTNSIRCKYYNLHRETFPTGDPNIPDEVWQAKHIKHLIGAKAEIFTGEEEFNLYEGHKVAAADTATDTAANNTTDTAPVAATVAVTAPVAANVAETVSVGGGSLATLAAVVTSLSASTLLHPKDHTPAGTLKW